MGARMSDYLYTNRFRELAVVQPGAGRVDFAAEQRDPQLRVVVHDEEQRAKERPEHGQQVQEHLEDDGELLDAAQDSKHAQHADEHDVADQGLLARDGDDVHLHAKAGDGGQRVEAVAIARPVRLGAVDRQLDLQTCAH